MAGEIISAIAQATTSQTSWVDSPLLRGFSESDAARFSSLLATQPVEPAAPAAPRPVSNVFGNGFGDDVLRGMEWVGRNYLEGSARVKEMLASPFGTLDQAKMVSLQLDMMDCSITVDCCSKLVSKVNQAIAGGIAPSNTFSVVNENALAVGGPITTNSEVNTLRFDGTAGILYTSNALLNYRGVSTSGGVGGYGNVKIRTLTGNLDVQQPITTTATGGEVNLSTVAGNVSLGDNISTLGNAFTQSHVQQLSGCRLRRHPAPGRGCRLR